MGYFRGTTARTRKHKRKLIKDFITFFQSLTACFHKIIICIDTNEPFIRGKSVAAKLVELTDLVDSLINKYGIEGEPSTHHRGSHRTDFVFYTPSIEHFISNIGILPIHEISPSDHRVLFLDIDLHVFLQDLDHITSSNSRL